MRKHTKIMAVVLAVCMLLSVMPMMAGAEFSYAEETFADGLETYEVTSEGYTKTYANGASITLKNDSTAGAGTYVIDGNLLKVTPGADNGVAGGAAMTFDFGEGNEMTGKVEVSFSMRWAENGYNFGSNAYLQASPFVQAIDNSGNSENLMGVNGTFIYIGNDVNAYRCSLDNCTESYNHWVKNYTMNMVSNPRGVGAPYRYKLCIDFDKNTYTVKTKMADGEWEKFYGYDTPADHIDHPVTMSTGNVENLSKLVFNFPRGNGNNGNPVYIEFGNLEVRKIVERTPLGGNVIAKESFEDSDFATDETGNATLSFVTPGDDDTVTWNNGGYLNIDSKVITSSDITSDDLTSDKVTGGAKGIFELNEAVSGKVEVSFKLKSTTFEGTAWNLSNFTDFIVFKNANGEAISKINLMNNNDVMFMGYDTFNGVYFNTAWNGICQLCKNTGERVHAINNNLHGGNTITLVFDLDNARVYGGDKAVNYWKHTAHGQTHPHVQAATSANGTWGAKETLKSIEFDFGARPQVAGTYDLSWILQDIEIKRISEDEGTSYIAYQNAYVTDDVTKTTVTEISAGQSITAEATVVSAEAVSGYNEAPADGQLADKPAKMYIGIYGADGALKQVVYAANPVSAWNETKMTKTFTVPQEADGGFIRIFVWRDDLVPFGKAS